MVRRAKLSIRHARAHAAELYVRVRISEIHLDLFHRAGRKKTARTCNIRLHSPIREAATNAHHILLRNPDIHESFWKPRPEVFQLCRRDGVVNDGTNLWISCRHLLQSLRERVTAIKHHWLPAVAHQYRITLCPLYSNHG